MPEYFCLDGSCDWAGATPDYEPIAPNMELPMCPICGFDVEVDEDIPPDPDLERSRLASRR
jgi:hypothetical protein